MSILIRLQFPGGRYHATPWGRHVNEGVPEWPPSPWRFLRALIAVWRRTCPDLATEQVQRVIQKLLAPPRFKLPAHRVAHTRHYMPWEKKGPLDRTLVFDTFVAVHRSDPLFLGWPDQYLNPEEQTVLAKLLANLSFLGRAEAWVTGTLSPETIDWNCVPTTSSEINPVRVFCPDPDTALSDDYYPSLDPKKLKKRLKLDELLFDCPRWHLCLDTQILHSERWPMVPGAKWVNYSCPVKQRAESTTPAKQNRVNPTVVRFLLDGPVLPLVTETITIAEVARWAVMSRFRHYCQKNGLNPYRITKPDGTFDFSTETFSGKTKDGAFLRDHNHAYYLPADEDGDGRLDHLTVYCPSGFNEHEVAALNRLRNLRIKDGMELHLAMVGLGQPSDFRCPLFGPATTWKSVTPFLVTRHYKARGKKRDPLECRGMVGRSAFVVRVLQEEMERFGPSLGKSLRLASDPEIVMPSQFPFPLEFRRGRSKRGDDGFRRACGFCQFTLEESLCGPFVLGHHAHFGLGLFQAES